ncbi:MAG: hypothetical protein J07HQW1_01366 [Haloquadratum walsbyi J07HQW1]|uniref:Uncharacterized protein n=1 Tax=Haloquadratum walsbyi J07HQW1 TaxID=1238424 RepID=U1PCM8_9EURY|nr:MAG: hypothetical protein J07HQW1_01366 [Haloquadratum walsbyi J07HQW1]
MSTEVSFLFEYYTPNLYRSEEHGESDRQSRDYPVEEPPTAWEYILLSTRRAPASPSRAYNKFARSTISRMNGGSCISSAKTKSRRPPHPATKRRVSISASATSRQSRATPTKPTCTPATASNKTGTTRRFARRHLRLTPLYRVPSKSRPLHQGGFPEVPGGLFRLRGRESPAREP